MTITAEQAAKLLEGTTPGPWELDGVRTHIAHVWPVHGSDEPITGEIDIANARLIAAAPDLARALIASEAARKLAEERLAKSVDALIWCSGSDDFQDDGKAREGWLKLCAPILKEIDNG